MKTLNRWCVFALGLALLWIAKTVGKAVVEHYAIPIPGPVIGMLLVFGVLLWLGRTPHVLSQAASPLLAHMNLLFIPAAVGLMGLGALLRDHGAGILASMLISTLLGFWTCVRVFTFLKHRDQQVD